MPQRSPVKYTHTGFSLIELLVVLVIIGIIISFAMLAAGDFGQSRRVQATAEALKQTISLVEQQAILANQTYALAVNNKGYRFYQWARDEHKHWHWQQVTGNKLLTFHAWPKVTTIRLQKKVAASQQRQANFIMIDVQGNLNPFRLGFYYRDHLITTLIGHGNGQLQLQNQTHH